MTNKNLLFCFIITLLSFTLNVACSQNTFSIYFTSPYADRVFCGVETSSGDYIFAGSREYQFDSVAGLLLKVTNEGDTLSLCYSKPDTICRFMGSYKTPDGFINLIGTLTEPVDNIYTSSFLYFWFVRLKPDLTIDFEKKYLIPADYKFLTDLKIMGLPGNLMLIGATGNALNSFVQRDDILLLKCNDDGDVQSCSFLNNTINFPNSFFDFGYFAGDSTIYVVGNNFAWNSAVQLLKLGTNYSIQQIKQLPNLNSFVSMKLLASNRFLFSGQYYPSGTSDRQIIVKKQSLNIVSDSILIGYSDSLEEPSYYNNLVKTSDNEYLVSCTVSQYIMGNLKTTLCLTKIDTTLNMLWQRYYPIGLPDYFTLGTFVGLDQGIWVYGIASTSSPPWQNEQVIFKLNQNGLLNGVQEIVNNHLNVGIYPCPFENEITIEPQSTLPIKFELYNMESKVLFTKIIDHPSIINLSFLASGVYPYNIYQGNILIKSDKLIKIDR